jgi:hypothetical protein
LATKKDQKKVVFDPSVYEDEKIKNTLSMLEEGKSREEISEYYGHGVQGLNQYFYRKGFHWNGNTYVPKENEGISAADEAKFVTTKAGQIVRQLSQKHVNIKQLAIKSGFSTVDEMGDYMKAQGYVWNAEESNYEYDETIAQKQGAAQGHLKSSPLEIGADVPNEYETLLTYLFSKKEKLFALLEGEEEGTLPRYKFRGAKASKTLGLPTTLQTLLEDYSNDYNVTQRAIIEIALADFFKRYGYEEQLNTVLMG